MRYPLLTVRENVTPWAQRLCAQLEADFNRAPGQRILRPAISANAVTLDLANADTFFVTLTANLSTITAILPKATVVERFDLMIILKQDGTGSRTVTWPGPWLWAGGGAGPTVTAAANSIDIFDFTIIDSVYYGRIFGQNMS